jgi:thiol:disulfide interchange protein
VARLLMAVVGLGFLVWLAHLGSARRWLGKLGGVLAMAALLAWSWPTTLAPSAVLAEALADDAWQPYEQAALDAQLAGGRPVFVDFTAAWCVSCQVNKRLVLTNADTLRAFARADVLLMRADWTRRDAAITAALARLGRNGVPVYALFRPGRETLLLPEILSVGLVREGLAFPMFAAAVWLLWVLGQQAGVDAVARLLMAVVGLGFLVWLAHLGSARRWLGKLGGVLAMAALLAWSWPASLAPAPADAHADDAWRPYEQAALDAQLAGGRPVFVDFTAAWCVSCQVNKRLVLNNADTLRAFARAEVVLMRADWTRRDAAITAALARLGRNGVPVYALFRPGRETLLLPEILSVGLVREALASLQP